MELWAYRGLETLAGLLTRPASDSLSFVLTAQPPQASVKLTFDLRPLGLGGKQAAGENCAVEQAGCLGAARMFC